MRTLKVQLLSWPILALVLLSSCGDDDENASAIALGTSVTITNTLQSDATTGGVETPIETLFMMEANALASTATVSEAVEFPGYLLGLYDVDIAENSISFELVAPVDDPTYGSFFRTLEAGTTDRYYLTFTEDQNVSGFSSSDPAVTLRIDSDSVVVVEIGEGFDFNPGTTFTLTLN